MENIINKLYNSLTVDHYQTLRQSTKWPKVKDEAAKQAISRDLFNVCIFQNLEIVGAGRVIGDGAIYFYIQDLIVSPKFKNQGFGKIIMDDLMSYITSVVSDFAFIGLMAAKDVGGFYAKFGFDNREMDSPGMFKIIQPQSNPFLLDRPDS